VQAVQQERFVTFAAYIAGRRMYAVVVVVGGQRVERATERRKGGGPAMVAFTVRRRDRQPHQPVNEPVAGRAGGAT